MYYVKLMGPQADRAMETLGGCVERKQCRVLFLLAPQGRVSRTKDYLSGDLEWWTWSGDLGQ